MEKEASITKAKRQGNASEKETKPISISVPLGTSNDINLYCNEGGGVDRSRTGVNIDDDSIVVADQVSFEEGIFEAIGKLMIGNSTIVIENKSFGKDNFKS